MRSLRARLLTGMIGSIALLLLLFGILIYVAIRQALMREFDASLLASAHAMAASVESDDDEIEIEFDPARVPELRNKEMPSYFQFWSEDGMVLLRSESLGRRDLPKFHGERGKPVFRRVVLHVGETVRALGVCFAPAVEEEYFLDEGGEGRALKNDTERLPLLTLVVAKSTRQLDEQLVFFRWLLAGSGGVTMIAALVISLLIVRRGLRPLNALAERIAAIREEELSIRIPGRQVPAELAPVVERLNDLLRRLETAFKRERSFTSNVAHELRTPLCGARTTIEVALSRERAPGEYVEALNDSLQIIQRMHTMVERLLLLARLEAGQIVLGKETVHLSEVVDACWESVSEEAEARGLSFDNRIPEHLTCVAESESIIMVFANLLENAAQYADRNGRIWATGKQTDGSIDITVANTGCTLTGEQASRAFEPFWRADASRKATGVHCGLGLAVVRRIIRALGGSVAGDVQDGGVFAARITLPRE